MALILFLFATRTPGIISNVALAIFVVKACGESFALLRTPLCLGWAGTEAGRNFRGARWMEGC